MSKQAEADERHKPGKAAETHLSKADAHSLHNRIMKSERFDSGKDAAGQQLDEEKLIAQANQALKDKLPSGVSVLGFEKDGNLILKDTKANDGKQRIYVVDSEGKVSRSLELSNDEKDKHDLLKEVLATKRTEALANSFKVAEFKVGDILSLSRRELLKDIEKMLSEKHKEEVVRQLVKEHPGARVHGDAVDEYIKEEVKSLLKTIGQELKNQFPQGIQVIGIGTGKEGQANGLVLTDQRNGQERRYILDFSGRISKILEGSGQSQIQGQSLVEDRDGVGRPTKISNHRGTFTYEYGSDGGVTKVTIKNKSGTHTYERQPDGSWTDNGKENQDVKDMRVNKEGDLVIRYKDNNRHIEKTDGTTIDYGPGRMITRYPDGSEEAWYANRTGYKRTPDGHGGYTEKHYGERPDDNFVLKKNAKGEIEILEADKSRRCKPKEGEPYKPIDDPKVKAERGRLDKLADRKLTDPQEREKFRADMARFEARAQQLEEMYKAQGKSASEARKLAHEQIAKTYEQTAKLLESKDNPKVPINDKQRIQLAEQIMRQAATPTIIDQGQHNTCNVACIEVRAYTRNPAEAARLVVEIATTGQYTTNEKDPNRRTTVKLDPASLHADGEAVRNPPFDGDRSFASQLFQVTAVNVYYASSNSSIRYEQHKPDPKAIPPDTGERLIDYSKKPPQEVRGEKNEKLREPCFGGKEIVAAGNKILGETNKDWYIEWAKEPVKGLNTIQSRHQLQEKIAEAKRTGKLPITIGVETGNEPFHSDSGAGSAGGSGGAHVVNVTDYDPGPPPTVTVDNQWGSKQDHSGERKMSLNELYMTMRVPTDREQITLYEKTVAEKRAQGKPDYFGELEVLRLKHDANMLNEKDYDRLLKEKIKEINYEAIKFGKEIEPKVREKIYDLVDGAPIDKRFPLIKYMNEIGMINDKAYDGYLAHEMARIRRQQQQSVKEGKFDQAKKTQYLRASQQFWDLVQQLPKERRAAILADLERRLKA